LLSILHNFYASFWLNKQLVACVGIGALVLMLGYTTDIKFLQKKLHLAREQKTKMEQLLKNKKPMVSKIGGEIPKKTFVAKLNQFVGDFGVADILNSLEKASTNSQVELRLLEPQAIKEDQGFVLYPIKIEICGQYQNLIGFINNVFKQPCFAAFEELVLQKKAGDDEKLSMRALMVVYKNKMPVEKTAASEPAPTENDAITLPERDIFTKTTSKTNLFLWASRELSFLGLMKQNWVVYGFVGDPMGGIHRVVVGDKIGLKQSKIVAIDERGIIVANKADNVLFVNPIQASSGSRRL